MFMFEIRAMPYELLTGTYFVFHTVLYKSAAIGEGVRGCRPTVSLSASPAI
jgi:hypothetical protein